MIKVPAVWLFFFFFVSSSALACVDAKRLIKNYFSDRTALLIGVDIDNTLLDTDAFVVRRVIPAVIGALMPSLSRGQKQVFKRFLRDLSKADPVLPESFTPNKWRSWRIFPFDRLPEDLADIFGIRSSSPLHAFWAKMDQVFRARMHEPAAHAQVPAVMDFLEALSTQKETQIVFVTARKSILRKKTLGQLRRAMNTPIRDADLVMGGTWAGGDTSNAVMGKWKALHIKDRGGFDLFLDDDPSYLREIARLNPDLLLLRVLWDSQHAQRVIKMWP